jgi:hypothetical protein
MRIQPRQQLLDIWRAVARASFREGRWQWGGRDPANAVSDAEQLLCIMLPATEIPRFRLDRPDQTEDDIATALDRIGSRTRIPQVMVKVLIDYHQRYADADGVPRFSGGSYFTSMTDEELTAQQRDLDVVESFGSSITLTLATLGFARIFRGELTQPKLLAELDLLEELAHRRLTAAMVGLLRSFTIFVFDSSSPEGQALVRTVNQSGQSINRTVEELRLKLRPVIAGLRDLTVGIDSTTELDDTVNLFEVGWSWGVIKGAPPVDIVREVDTQADGLADYKPYLYFTVQALDGIADLFSERTRLLRLLDDEQLRLASALQLRWDLTQTYWSIIASFGSDRWPLEDIPWRTTDGAESDYFSLLVTSIAARDLATRRDTDSDLSRLGQVLTELANRGRITRRPTKDDPAVQMHTQGVDVDLAGIDEIGPPVKWVASDFAPLLLKRATRIAGLINDINLRSRVLELADDVWDHLAKRRMRQGTGIGLWDQPSGVYPTVDEHHSEPSWHHTVRVVESLVFAADLAGSHPLRSEPLAELAKALIAEAEHLFDQELLAGSTEAGASMRTVLQGVRTKLRHARDLMGDRPGTCISLVQDVLLELDQLATARRDVIGGA